MKDAYQRRRRGVQIMKTLFELKDAEAGANCLEADFGALGSFTIDFVYGEIWSRLALNAKDRHLIVLAALTTTGVHEEIPKYVASALRSGLTGDEIREVFVVCSAYAGFPRAFSAKRVALRALKALGAIPEAGVLSPAARLSDEARFEKGAEVLQRIAGNTEHDPKEVLTSLVGRLGALGEYAIPYGFGDVWGREYLTPRQRSFVVVTILTCLGCPNEIRIHVGAAFRHGIARMELEELMLMVFAYAGAPLAVEGMRVLEEVETPLPGE